MSATAKIGQLMGNEVVYESHGISAASKLAVTNTFLHSWWQLRVTTGCTATQHLHRHFSSNKYP
jgi:hypothetical protein